MTKAPTHLRKFVASLKPWVARVRLGGGYWAVYRIPAQYLPDTDGYADTDNRFIVIGDHLKGEKLLDTLLHEALHAIYPWVDESYVRSGATELARLEKRLGYV